jgi:hypothetical protein
VFFIERATHFDTMYARVRRPSIALEKPLPEQLLQIRYSIRGEGLLIG